MSNLEAQVGKAYRHLCRPRPWRTNDKQLPLVALAPPDESTDSGGSAPHVAYSAEQKAKEGEDDKRGASRPMLHDVLPCNT